MYVCTYEHWYINKSIPPISKIKQFVPHVNVMCKSLKGDMNLCISCKAYYRSVPFTLLIPIILEFIIFFVLPLPFIFLFNPFTEAF